MKSQLLPLAVAVTSALALLAISHVASSELRTEPEAVPAELRAISPRGVPEAQIDPLPTAVRQAVRRSLPYLAEHGVAWIDKHQCASCHQVPAMIWSHQAAAARGLVADEERLAKWTRWTLANMRETGADNVDGVFQMILARSEDSESWPASDIAALVDIVAQSQEDDGSWKARGQLPLQRRSEQESHDVESGWALLALASYDPPSDNLPSSDRFSEILERGRERFEVAREARGGGESNEWLVVRLLYADRFSDASAAGRLRAQLLDEQNEDGGWSWLRGEGSDAFATGQSLYALTLVDRQYPRNDPVARDAVDRALEHLLETQREDGSWNVRSTLSREEGPTPTGVYWGTGWAAIGLASALPEEGGTSYRS